MAARRGGGRAVAGGCAGTVPGHPATGRQRVVAVGSVGAAYERSGEIRRWLRQQTGLDVPLPAATAVRLEGARVGRRGAQRVAAVVFHVKQDTVTLLVARADPGRPLPPHGGRVAAWQARDQVYALASSDPERVEAACHSRHASCRPHSSLHFCPDSQRLEPIAGTVGSSIAFC